LKSLLVDAAAASQLLGVTVQSLEWLDDSKRAAVLAATAHQKSPEGPNNSHANHYGGFAPSPGPDMISVQGGGDTSIVGIPLDVTTAVVMLCAMVTVITGVCLAVCWRHRKIRKLHDVSCRDHLAEHVEDSTEFHAPGAGTIEDGSMPEEVRLRVGTDFHDAVLETHVDAEEAPDLMIEVRDPDSLEIAVDVDDLAETRRPAIGDQVRITRRGHPFWNKTGIVVDDNGGVLPFQVDVLDATEDSPDRPVVGQDWFAAEDLFVEATIKGIWDEGMIHGGTLTFNSGSSVLLRNRTATYAKLTGLDGKVYEIRLEADGKLHWSNGDVWDRIEDVLEDECFGIAEEQTPKAASSLHVKHL
jgi:hypothetical protein